RVRAPSAPSPSGDPPPWLAPAAPNFAPGVLFSSISPGALPARPGRAAAPPGLPGPGAGPPAASPAPHVPWTPPSPSAAPTAPQPGLEQIPPDLAQRLRQLPAADVVDLALRNNPTTLQAWANARAAAAAYGASRGAYFPEVDPSASITHVKTAATGGRVAVTQTTYGPSATLTWLLLDF